MKPTREQDEDGSTRSSKGVLREKRSGEYVFQDGVVRAPGHAGEGPKGKFAHSVEAPCMGDSAREVVEEWI
jgi:hypothetical protein